MTPNKTDDRSTDVSPDVGRTGAAEAGEAPRRSSLDAMKRTRAHAAANALMLGTVLLIIIFSLLSDVFLTVQNFRDILVQVSVIAVVAVPTALLVIAARVDLSIGSTLALGAVVTGLLITDNTVGVIPAIAAGIAGGAIVGAVNGVLVTVLGLSPIIVTLGALTAVRGLSLTVAPDPLFNFSPAFVNLGQGALLGVPYLVLIAAAVFLLGAAVLAQMPVGRHIYAIGVNEEAAYLSGVRVKQITLVLFIATGAAAGLAGVMLAARIGSAPSGVLGVGFELDVLTAVILGGVAFSGGRGTITGVFLGVVFLGILQNGLTLENVPTATASMIKGMVLVVAAGLDRIAMRSPNVPRAPTRSESASANRETAET